MDTCRVYHYVYRITNKVTNKHYYGKRSSKKVKPVDDLGKRYFSSSTDKSFIQDQKDNPQNYKYKIVSLHRTAVEAVKKEIKLHSKFDVGVNLKFYNKAKQTSVGFDMTGLARPQKDKQKIKIDKRKLPRTEESKKLISLLLKGIKRTDLQKINYSMSKQGDKHPKARLANIYEYGTNKVIASNIIISEWCRHNGYDRNGLLQTIKGDVTLPPSRTNRCKYKNMYARYVNA